MMCSTKKIWKVTIFWLGMENGFWFEKNETPPYCKSSLCCVISVSDSSVHFVAEFLHCSVKSGLSLQPWDTPSRDPRLKTEPTSRGALYDCVSWFKTIFFFTAFIINEVEEELETLILQSKCTDMHLKRFLGVSKHTRNYFFHILVALSDV